MKNQAGPGPPLNHYSANSAHSDPQARYQRPACPRIHGVFASFDLCGANEVNVTAATESGVIFPAENLDTLLDLARFLELHTEPALLLGPG
jgi:hypothetical protein